MTSSVECRHTGMLEALPFRFYTLINFSPYSASVSRVRDAGWRLKEHKRSLNVARALLRTTLALRKVLQFLECVQVRAWGKYFANRLTYRMKMHRKLYKANPQPLNFIKYFAVFFKLTDWVLQKVDFKTIILSLFRFVFISYLLYVKMITIETQYFCLKSHF